MADYRVISAKGITRRVDNDDDDELETERLEQGDVWEDPPEHVLGAFGDTLEKIEEDEEEEDDEPETSEDGDEGNESDQEEEEAEDQGEGLPDDATEGDLEGLSRNELRSQYAKYIDEVDGNASADDMREQILDYYAED